MILCLLLLSGIGLSSMLTMYFAYRNNKYNDCTGMTTFRVINLSFVFSARFLNSLTNWKPEDLLEPSINCSNFWLESFLVSLVNYQHVMIGRIIWQQFPLRFIIYLTSPFNLSNGFQFPVLRWRLTTFHNLNRFGWRDTWRWEVLMEVHGGDCVPFQLSG